MSRPFIAFLHFFGSSGREWTTLADELEPDFETMTLDLPGFGDAADQSPQDVGGMADYVDRHLVAAARARCVVVGHSMSGKVAAVLASRSPAYLRGLVLVTASPPSPEPMRAESRRKLLAFDGSRAGAADYIDGITATRLPDGLREIAIADARRASLAAWKAWVIDGSQEDWSAAVGQLDLPTLVVAGASDPSLGADIQRARVMPHFPNASLITIAGGHVLPLENPRDLSREIRQFMQRLESPAHLSPA